MQIACVGTQRFRLRSSELQKHGLWTAEAEAVPDDVALAVPDDLRAVSDALRRLVDTLEERRRMEGGEQMRLPIQAPFRFDDCGWVANRWCELLPVPVELKQRLMELDSPLDAARAGRATCSRAPASPSSRIQRICAEASAG